MSKLSVIKEDDLEDLLSKIDDILVNPDAQLQTNLIEQLRASYRKILSEKKVPVDVDKYYLFRDQFLGSVSRFVLDNSGDVQPRFLTDEERKYITNYAIMSSPVTISPLPGRQSEESHPDTTDSVLDRVWGSLYDHLGQIKITPLSIPDLMVEIKRQWLRTLVEPGTLVGGYAANAIGQQITQGALDSFHSSGSSRNIAMGVRGVDELLSASSDRKNPASTFYFNDPVTVDDVLIDKTAELVQLLVIDPTNGVVTDNYIDTTQNIFRTDQIKTTEPVDEGEVTEPVEEGEVTEPVEEGEVTEPVEEGEVTEPWWYGPYRDFVNPELPILKPVPMVEPEKDYLSAWMLRLTINQNKLVKHQTNLQKICEAIVRSLRTVTDGTIYCVPSPLMEHVVQKLKTYENEDGDIIEGLLDTYEDRAYIDVFVNEREIVIDSGSIGSVITDEEEKSLYFLNQFVLPHLNKVQIKGIPGIIELYPISHNIWGAVESNTLYDIREDGTLVWLMTYNHSMMRKTGVQIESVHNLAKVTGLEVQSKTPDDPWNMDYFFTTTRHEDRPKDFLTILGLKKIEPTEYIPSDSGMIALYRKYGSVEHFYTPTQWVNYMVRTEARETRQKERDLRNERRDMFPVNPEEARKMITSVPMSDRPIESASEMVTADTDGSNMIEMLNHSGINPYYSYGNNIYKVLSILGIEATREFINGELEPVLGGVDTRHRNLAGDYMTRLGFITKFRDGGFKHQGGGPLSEAVFADPISHLGTAAAFGERHSIRATSASLILGNRISIGTGAVDIVLPEGEEEQFYQYAQDGIFDPISEDAISSALDEIDDDVLMFGDTDFAYQDPSGDYRGFHGESLSYHQLSAGRISGKGSGTVMTTPAPQSSSYLLQEVADRLSNESCLPPINTVGPVIESAYRDIGPRIDPTTIATYDQISMDTKRDLESSL